MSAGERPWPTELKLAKDKTQLTITFDNGQAYTLSAEYLRVESPSAEVQGHAPSQKQVVQGKKNVKIESLEPVGNYAVRIRFDDGHDTGLYSWDYLQELGSHFAEKWQAYESALRAKGLHRA